MAWEAAEEEEKEQEIALMNELKEMDREMARLARNSALVACATVPLATLVAEQHTCP